MGRLMGFVLFVGVLWIGVEFYAEGPSEAFGGAFAGVLETEPSEYDEEADASNPIQRSQRAADSFNRAYRASEDRVDRALER